ncbi:MAG: hypothetical protein LBT26_00140 [Clostridiales Family XIII bacterium]|jgi:hypothetical protein|nr:hypothetical protein [Clostridiales Family XIII bacterium]
MQTPIFLYSTLWVKFRMKKNCFESVPITELAGVKVRFDDEPAKQDAQ